MAVLSVLLFAAQSSFAQAGYAEKRILWVESYHQGFPWSDGIAQGVHEVLDPSGVTLRVEHMDTKSNDSEEFAVQAGKRVLDVFKEFKPDVVMASDDNAQRYFVVPYLKGTDTPVVFCGVNWDAANHGYPAPNITGMVEVNLLQEALSMLSRFAKGSRVAYISADTETERGNLDIYTGRGIATQWTRYLISDFKDFPAAYRQAQKNADMIVMGGNGGIEGWDDAKARAFLAREASIPSGSFDFYLAPYTMFTFAKRPQEQGHWMASTALRILDGEKPSDIPLVENQQADLIVNLKLAQAARLVLPVSLLETATVIERP